MPERVPVEVRLLPPIRPTGTGWDAAVAARDEVRGVLLTELREPDLGAQ
jgi:hypothetical protein